MTLAKLYLSAYNLFCASGWALVLFIFAKAQFESADWGETWNRVSITLIAVQSAAILEVIHALIGLVQSPWTTTLVQVTSRLVVAWGFLYSCRASQEHYGMALAVVSWSLVEVPRYLFYYFNLKGSKNVPSTLFWLRYSLFAVLYPSGITGEILTIIQGLDCLKVMPELSLFAGLSINWFYAGFFILATYVPGAPYMYFHMVTTRKKQFKRRNQKIASKTK